jgi:hypothetical protein
VVQVDQWRPAAGEQSPRDMPLYGFLARKP